MNCRSCPGQKLDMALELAAQPVAHQFQNHSTWPRYEMELAQCPSCGLVHLSKGPGAEQLLPKVAWITYNEPESHLDSLAERLGGATRALGITYKDDSLLRRLRQQSAELVTWRLDPQEDLGVESDCAGLESWQAALHPDCARAWLDSHDRVDLVIARHIFEHAFDPAAFLGFVQTVLSPEGRLVLEVPDCSRTLAAGDFTTVWEEHLAYYTPATFRSCLRNHGWQLEQFMDYPQAMENSLVGVWRLGREDTTVDAPIAERALYSRFVERFLPTRTALAEWAAKQQGRRVALVGAGHLANAFFHLLGASGMVTDILDDNPHKLGLRFPGTDLVVQPVQTLLEGTIETALLAINPENEQRILDRFADWSGRFYSIFPTSSRYLLA